MWSQFYCNWNFVLLICVLPVSTQTFLSKPRKTMRTAYRSQFRPSVLHSCWISSRCSMTVKAVRISVFQFWSPLDTLPGCFLVNSRQIFRSHWPFKAHLLLSTLPLKTLHIFLHYMCVYVFVCVCVCLFVAVCMYMCFMILTINKIYLKNTALLKLRHSVHCTFSFLILAEVQTV
jgi:hypothetical protein